MTLLLLIGGLATLVLGAELLVRGSSRLATRLGISPVVVGLTVVAFGTSAPELAASVGSVLNGRAELALGNAVGSNTFNVLAILGLTAVVAPIAVNSRLIRLDIPIMIGVSLALLLVSLDGQIGRLEGLVFVTVLVGYATFLVWQARREPEVVQAEFAAELPDSDASRRSLTVSLLLVAVGLGALVAGAGWLVEGAVTLADWLGVDQRVVGLTVVAAGTSLPELAASVVAAVRRSPDIAIGNVVGSNIFNLLGVLGTSAAVAPAGIPVSAASLRVDLPVMLGAAMLCLPLAITARRISRAEGIALLVGLVAYFTWLAMS